jgi:sugar phosphate isomerase/epimerase
VVIAKGLEENIFRREFNNMKGPLSNYMKVGIVHFMAFPSTGKGEGPVYETIKQIAEDEFFSAIEITWIKDPDVRKKVADLLKTTKMTVGFGAQPFLLTTGLDLNSLDDAHRKKAVDQIKRAVDEAYEIGAQRIAFLSGKDPGDADRARATDLLIDSVKQICAYAKSKGDMAVTLETFDRSIEKMALLGPSVEAAKVAAEIKKDYPDFGLMIDLSHLPQLNEASAESLEATKDHLVHIHIGNCVVTDKSHPAYGDQHPRFGIEGGSNDVDELVDFLKALFDVGYLSSDKKELPVVAFEVKPMGDETPEMVIANAKRTLLEAWAKLDISCC